MRVNIEIDDGLLGEAMRPAGTTTVRTTVEAALAELIRRYRLKQVLELRGTVEWVGDLDRMRTGRIR